MKKSLLRLIALAFALLLVAPAFAQPSANPGDKANAASPEITWTRGESRELANLRVELDIMRKRDSDKHPSVIEMQHRIEAVESRQPWLLSFDFSGGPLSKFLNLVGRTKVVSFNMVASDPNDLAAELPPFSLRNANTNTVIGVLTNLLDQRGYTLKFFGDPNEANSMTGVLSRSAGAHLASQPSPALFESFSLQNQLGSQSIDEIVATIREAWELDPSHDPKALRLKFHPSTAILLVSGPAEAIQVTGKVVSQLPKDKDVKSTKQPAAPTSK